MPPRYLNYSGLNAIVGVWPVQILNGAKEIGLQMICFWNGIWNSEAKSFKSGVTWHHLWKFPREIVIKMVHGNYPAHVLAEYKISKQREPEIWPFKLRNNWNPQLKYIFKRLGSRYCYGFNPNHSQSGLLVLISDTIPNLNYLKPNLLASGQSLVTEWANGLKMSYSKDTIITISYWTFSGSIWLLD